MAFLRRVLAWLFGSPESARPSRPRRDDEPRLADEADPDAIVEVPIEDSIDLHTFAPRDVTSVVEEYLHAARAAGFAEVRVIHGKGKGVQRAAVRRVLARHPAVESFRQAPATRGGWGATLVVLLPVESEAP